MGFGSALAIGFLKGRTEKMAAEATRKAELAKEEREYQRSQNELAVNLLGDFMQSEDVSVTLPPGFSTKNLTPAEVFAMTSKMASAENDIMFGSKSSGFSIPKPDLTGKTGLYKSAEAELQNLNQWLMNPDNKQKAIDVIQSSPDARNSLFNYIAQQENNYLMGWSKLQRENQTIGANEVSVTDISNFGNIVDLHKYYTDDERSSVKQEPIPTENDPFLEDKNIAQFNVRVDPDGSQVRMSRQLSEQEAKALGNLAGRLGMSKDEFVESFYSTATIPTQTQFSENVYEGKTNEQIVDMQYSMFRDVLRLESMGFGALMQDPLSMSIAKRTELGTYLRKTYGNDRYRMAVAVSYLAPTPDYFKSTEKNTRYFSKPTAQLSVNKNGRAFLTDELKMSDSEIKAIQDGYKYSNDTLSMLNELKSIEANQLADAQGLARELERVVLGAGTQLKQVGGVVSNLFSSNDVFVGNVRDENTNAKTLTTTLERMVENGTFKLSEGSTLTNLAKVDALKLALAARMARAIDPSGRLSNQDFEIQLKRLGGALIEDADTVQAKLGLLVDEFSRELQRNTVLNAVSQPTATIDARTARAIIADRQIEIALYGDPTVASGISQDVQQKKSEPEVTYQEVQPEGSVQIDGITTKDGLPIFAIPSGDENTDDTYFVFEEGLGYRPMKLEELDL